MRRNLIDTVSKSIRSSIMSRIRAKNTKPEKIVRSFLHSKGLRFRLHVKGMAGTPDLLLPKYKTAIFVNGCFWHGHENCKYSRTPKSNTEFWNAKITRNKERDSRKANELKAIGWRVIIFWECQTTQEKLEDLVNAIKYTTKPQ